MCPLAYRSYIIAAAKTGMGRNTNLAIQQDTLHQMNCYIFMPILSITRAIASNCGLRQMEILKIIRLMQVNFQDNIYFGISEEDNVLQSMWSSIAR